MKPETKTYYRDAVLRALQLIFERLDQPLDLAALSREVAISQFHFHRIFRGMLAETPAQLHRRLRLERAAWALISQDCGILEVALCAGYETHESFTRAFGAYYGFAPSELKQRQLGCASDVGLICLESRCGIHVIKGRLICPDDPFVNEELKMQVQVEQLEAMALACVQHVGPYPQIGHAFRALGELAGPHGLFGPQTKMLALFHDDPDAVESEALRSDAAISLASSAVALPEGLSAKQLEGGLYASALYKGSYEGLGQAWGELMGQWLPKSGYKARASECFEVYENSPEEVSPQDLLTRLYVPITAL